MRFAALHEALGERRTRPDWVTRLGSDWYAGECWHPSRVLCIHKLLGCLGWQWVDHAFV